MQVKLFENGYRMRQVKEALSYHGHDYTWKDLANRTASFSMGFARMGYPYTIWSFLRDLMQPSRYAITAQATLSKKLRSWKEFAYPFAMCWMQYKGTRDALKSQKSEPFILDRPEPKTLNPQPSPS